MARNGGAHYNPDLQQQQGGQREAGRGRGRGNPQQQGGQREAGRGQARGNPQQQGGQREAGRGRARGNPQQQGGRGRDYQGRGGAYPHQGRGAPSQSFCRPPAGRGKPEHYPAAAGGASPSRPPLPELQQVTQAPSQEASSSRPSDVPTEELQQLSLQTEPANSQAIVPVSSKQERFPLRPSKGRAGSKCLVKANHFFAQLSDKEFFHYDVSITPEVASRKINRSVINQLVKLFQASDLGGRLPVYDGRKSLYTAGSLPFISKEFQITLPDENDGADPANDGVVAARSFSSQDKMNCFVQTPDRAFHRRPKNFKVVIKFAARSDLYQLNMFLAGRQEDAPQEVLQILDIVLREWPTAWYCPVGRSFFSSDLCKKNSLGEGLECWRGFYQSIRPTEMGLSLNIDISSTAFIEASPVVAFVKKLLGLEVRDDQLRMLTDTQRATVNKSLKGVKVEVIHRGDMRRKYRIASLTPQATRDLSFPVDESGTMKTVVQYFQDTYRFLIKVLDWPCLQVGNPQKPNYLPMEVCKIVKGQRYSKRLSGRQVTAFLKATCQRPQERESDIIMTVDQNEYHLDPYAKEFGIKIHTELASVKARLLPAPRLKYSETGEEQSCLPIKGQWNMVNKKMVNGGTVSNWTCINFANAREDLVSRFCYELAYMCQTSGMQFALDPVMRPSSARPNQVERELKSLYTKAMTILRQQQKELDLLIVILPENNGSLYGDIKRICETEIGLVTQCCLVKHVPNPNKQYLANVALKINVKVGGRNTVLVDAMSKSLPLVGNKPTIIFGADVTHPHPGEDSSPSIAAVVASQDWPEITKYAGLVSAQAHRQEIIEDLFTLESDPQRGNVSGGMIRDLLISFRKATGGIKPERIIFYRDGVSEGQFNQVLLRELDAIRKACASLKSDYRPPVTFVVVQKRHHTRLFANNHSNLRSVDRSGNILPGTVVDSDICHPSEFDFYLCSHAGIQGTSRPAHYHVLCDENNFSADELQTLTNSLCYTYARCTRSVSIVPPAYYAHLAASRARFYMNPTTSESPSQPRAAAANEPRNTRVAGGGAVRPLPPLKDNVKRVMFYC